MLLTDGEKPAVLATQMIGAYDGGKAGWGGLGKTPWAAQERFKATVSVLPHVLH